MIWFPLTHNIRHTLHTICKCLCWAFTRLTRKYCWGYYPSPTHPTLNAPNLCLLTTLHYLHSMTLWYIGCNRLSDPKQQLDLIQAISLFPHNPKLTNNCDSRRVLGEKGNFWLGLELLKTCRLLCIESVVCGNSRGILSNHVILGFKVEDFSRKTVMRGVERVTRCLMMYSLGMTLLNKQERHLDKTNSVFLFRGGEGHNDGQ